MNTISRISFALVSTLAIGALTACGANGEMNEMMGEVDEVAEMVGEAEQAIATATAPVLSAGTLYRVEIMPEVDHDDQKCVDFPANSLVSLGQPLVRRDCNDQHLDNNQNTQAFYFEPLYVGGTRVPNRYKMKPVHKLNSSEDLCVYNSGAGLGNGGNLLAGTCNPNTDARIVEIKAYTDDSEGAIWTSFLTINMVHSGKCLSVVGSYPGENVTITQYGTANDAEKACAVWPNQRVHIVTE